MDVPSPVRGVGVIALIDPLIVTETRVASYRREVLGSIGIGVGESMEAVELGLMLSAHVIVQRPLPTRRRGGEVDRMKGSEDGRYVTPVANSL